MRRIKFFSILSLFNFSGNIPEYYPGIDNCHDQKMNSLLVLITCCAIKDDEVYNQIYT